MKIEYNRESVAEDVLVRYLLAHLYLSEIKAM